MANATEPGLGDLPASNLTLSGNLTLYESLTQWGAIAAREKDLLFLEARLVFAAMACIYLGSYASLRRPPSANPPKRAKKGGKHEPEEKDDEFVQGLLPSDAIVFPILAGIVLVGLYYLIKWLEDPDILNRILRYYFSAMSLASMGKLFADGLQFLTNLIFPTVWTDFKGRLREVDQAMRAQYMKSSTGERQLDPERKSPLGLSPNIKLGEKTNKQLWELRNLLREPWTIRLRIHGIVNEKFNVKFNDIHGVAVAILANILYHTTNSTFLSNVMGYAFSYVGIIMMSPTTFTTGTAVLFGLFFYDIYMVFYTPYMVTVATKLDVPIKLVFEGPKKASMLGLGDIVLPGMFIGLCLRFDHYMYYHKQRKLEPVQLKTEQQSSASNGEVITSTETQRMVVKPDFVNPKGHWGDYLRTLALFKLFSPDATPELKASAFPKPYFWAAMAGYLVAMMTTLVMLFVSKHPQPALLYLVPGVAFAVWITGAIRGELREMWIYTEDGSLDKTDIVVEVDSEGNVVKEVGDETKGDKSKDDGKPKEAKTDSAEILQKETQPGSQTREEHPVTTSEGLSVFLLSVEAPTSRSKAD